MRNVSVKPVILAAGKGTRMKSDIPKVMHCILGIPMVEWVVKICEDCETLKPCLVIGHGSEMVENHFDKRCEYALQKNQLGTGDAVASAAQLLKNFQGTVLILCGDTPLISGRDISNAINHHFSNKNDLTVLTMNVEPAGYGRVIKNSEGLVTGIVEHRDCNSEQLKIREVNSGIYLVNSEKLFQGLGNIRSDNSQEEYYLTDIVNIFYHKKWKTDAFVMENPENAMGVNDRVALSEAARILRNRINTFWMESGVTIIDPESTWIEPGAEIGCDSIIYPFTYISKNGKIPSESIVKPHSYVEEDLCQ